MPEPVTPPPMQPMQSTTIKSLLLVGASQLLLQLIPMLQAHKFDPWGIGITVVTISAGILLRMASPDVKAPSVLNTMTFGLLNQSK